MLLKGIVKKGLHIGTKIGYPTINIEPDTKVDIEYGIYVCKIKIFDKVYNGVVHYGPKTIGTSDPAKIFCEAHIFNFDRDVYNQKVEIKLLKKIRDMRKFRSEASLKKQIAKDIEITNKYFNAEQT